MLIEVKDLLDTQKLGRTIGQLLKGGEVIELIGDVGAGKTTLVQAIGLGLDVKQPITSPSFTISQIYDCRDGLKLAHYDFYRLSEAGIMSEEIKESLNDKDTIAIIEWGEIIKDILPANRITIKIKALSSNSRQMEIMPEGFMK